MQGLPISEHSKYISINDAASKLEVSIDTIRRWEKKGFLKTKRNNANHRLFNIKDIKNLKKKLSNQYEGRRFKVLKSRKNGFNVIELFAGAGGLGLGLKNAGFETVLLTDNDKDSCNTLRQNFKKTKIVEDDISKINFSEFKGQIDVVTGGFPCQAFSYAGKGLGFEDTRGTLFFEFARCVKEVKPKIAVAENVRGLKQHDNGRTLRTMIKTMENLNYEIDYKILRSQFLDVPQKRERLFIIAKRKDIKSEILFPEEKDYVINLGDALKDCPESIGYEYKGKKAEIMKLVPPGGYWKNLPIVKQKEYMGGSFYLGGGKTGMARRLSMDEPSITLVTSPVMKQTERGHPTEMRPINIRESARIQTFPDNWEFSGSLASQYKQIGNAVPVNMAFYIGKAIQAMLENNTSSRLLKFTKGEYGESAQQMPLI